MYCFYHEDKVVFDFVEVVAGPARVEARNCRGALEEISEPLVEQISYSWIALTARTDQREKKNKKNLRDNEDACSEVAPYA